MLLCWFVVKTLDIVLHSFIDAKSHYFEAELHTSFKCRIERERERRANPTLIGEGKGKGEMGF